MLLSVCLAILLIILIGICVKNLSMVASDYEIPNKYQPPESTSSNDTWTKPSGTCMMCKRKGVPVSTVITSTSNQIGLIDVCADCYSKLDLTDKW